MNAAFFSTPSELISGLVIGVLFGFALNKANVTRFSTIVGQFLLKDFTVMKVIMSAIASGSLVLYVFKGFFPGIGLMISSTSLLAAFLGGCIFGIGMAVLGFCPGTCVGALSARTKDTWLGLLGMIFGAALYAEAFPWIKLHIKPAHKISKITLADYFQISPWFFIGGVILFVICFSLFEKYQKGQLVIRGK